MKHRQYCLDKIGLNSGIVYEHIDTEIFEWLIDEAIKIKADSLGLTIASILTDVYHEEKGEENEKS